MRAAFFTYPSAFQNIGGGEVLLLKVKEYVEKEGVTVDFFDTWKARIEDYDLLHIFGSVKDCLGMAQVAKTRGVKVVISPLWWSDFRRAFFTEGSFRTKTELVLRHASKLALPAFPSARRRLLQTADRLFPNSEMEKKQIARLFALPESNMRVVANGVDTSFCDADASLFKKKYGEEPFILGVGRIEPRKNQLNLIRAVRSLPGTKLVLIGSPVSGYESYFEACRREGGDFTRFIPTIPHGDPMLRSAYAACALFVLQGWFETPGLVAMEAALAGARVIATSGGSTTESFGSYVTYFNPADPSNMASAIKQALLRPVDPAFKAFVKENYNWEKIARDYVRLYSECVGKK